MTFLKESAVKPLKFTERGIVKSSFTTSVKFKVFTTVIKMK